MSFYWTLAQQYRIISLLFFYEAQRRIRDMLLASQSSIHITQDIWTSPNYFGVLAITAHFTDEEGTLQDLMLAMDEIEGVYSGQNIASYMLQTLDK